MAKNTNQFVTISRKDAARLLDNIREVLATGAPDKQAAIIGRMLSDFNIPPLAKCYGEAHSNAFIDNCMVCAPRWGLIGDPVKVK